MNCARYVLMSLFVVSLSIAARASSGFEGKWVNIDRDTSSITKVVIKREQGALKIRAFGSCHPQDCDWGLTHLRRNARGTTARYDQGFAKKQLFLGLMGRKRLRVRLVVKYRDGRPGRVEKLIFKRIPGISRLCPDLVVRKIERPIWDDATASSRIRVTIKNVGRRRARSSYARLTDLNSGNWDVELYPALNPGASATRTFKVAAPWIYSPNAHLRAEVDYKSMVKECKEGNNLKTFRDLG